ncbi:MAG: sulfatase [Flavobacteriaceae bacterium]|nr:MAG: sulfatase [Flavobacteriaceae bacterium]
MKTHYLIALVLLAMFSSCKKDDNAILISDDDEIITSNDDETIPSNDAPNILLIIADDLGKDAISGYSEGSIKPNTPNIDAIRNTGLSFNNLWVYPTCSPTRAAIITGKYGYRTGVKWAGDTMSNSEDVLHNYIKSQTNNEYATAAIGKWHLAGEGISTFNPETLGMDYYSGLLSGGSGYTQWTLSEDGVNTNQNEYITAKFTDLSIDWINGQEKPWFLWLAYTAPHTPFHVPPTEMHSQGNLPEYSLGMDPIPYYMAAIEAMDYQIGVLLDGIPEAERENTTIIIVGDNGTPNQVAQSPYSNATAKGSLYQGGINTPMFISGAAVSRVGTDDNLISGTDLFATISELAGIEVTEINDSKSFKSLLSSASIIREFQYSEMNNGTDDLWTIKNSQFKLIINANGYEELYDLNQDPYETVNLLDDTLTSAASQAKTALETELSEIRN